MTAVNEFLLIVQNHTLDKFITIFDRYAIAATLIATTVWLLKKTPLKSRQIQKRTPGFVDFRREFVASVGAVLVFVVLDLFIEYGFKHGVFRGVHTIPSWGTWLAMVGVLVIGHDTYFYWTHRAMHHRALFKFFHRYHHKSVTPTAWTAYSFHPAETVVELSLIHI